LTHADALKFQLQYIEWDNGSVGTLSMLGSADTKETDLKIKGTTAYTATTFMNPMASYNDSADKTLN
jgi:hypothetical protein